jgi:LacI family transcriptional regulator
MNDQAGRQTEAGEGRATIVDVARRAGVSKSTVSLVLGGSPLVAEATRERVSGAMIELGYIYHRGAATLRGAKSDVLGMVINDLSNPFYVELAIGIEQACQGGESGASATSDPLDARARRRRAGSGAGDRFVAR